MLDHVGIPIADYARSKAFYEKALAPLGYALVMEVPQTGNGEHVPRASAPTASRISGSAAKAASTTRVHIALLAKDRATVDAFYRAALAAGGKDNGAPGLRPHYHANYYGAFVFDPDGHNIEAVCHAPA